MKSGISIANYRSINKILWSDYSADNCYVYDSPENCIKKKSLTVAQNSFRMIIWNKIDGGECEKEVTDFNKYIQGSKGVGSSGYTTFILV